MDCLLVERREGAKCAERRRRRGRRVGKKLTARTMSDMERTIRVNDVFFQPTIEFVLVLTFDEELSSFRYLNCVRGWGGSQILKY